VGINYRLLNIPASTSIKSFQTKSYQLILVIQSFFWNIHTNLVLILDLLENFHSCLVLEGSNGPKADFWLVCGMCILGIETNMALLLNWYIAPSPYQASTGVWSWYYLMFLQGRFWYEVGILPNMMSSLVSRPVLVYIQLGTHSTPISTNVVWN
jgi:hypothetical protein